MIDRRPKLNREITFESFELLDRKGNSLGTFTRQQALFLAGDKNLDLVEVQIDPPICKLDDYGISYAEMIRRRK